MTVVSKVEDDEELWGVSIDGATNFYKCKNKDHAEFVKFCYDCDVISPFLEVSLV